MKIPNQFHLMGHVYTIEKIAPTKWKYKDSIGAFMPQSQKILLKKQQKTLYEHTFLHELTHAVLHSMDHPLYEDEAFVDTFSGLLHQALTTGEREASSGRRKKRVARHMVAESPGS